MEKQGLKAVVFGATGAVGKTLIPQLVQSGKWNKVLAVVRTEPAEWTKLKTNGKLQVQIQADMDRLFKTEEWKLEGYDAIYVCFGSQVKHGEQTFKKIDKTYPLLCADIAIRCKIPHYLLVSASSSNPDSMLLYVRTKGQVERDLKTKKLPLLSILRPGLIKDRPDARFGQKVAQFFSFLPFPSISCEELCRAMKGLAQTKVVEAKNSSQKTTIYENGDLLNFLKEYEGKNNKPSSL